MRIALIGYGKMGKAIEEIAVQRGHTIHLKISSSNREDLTRERLKNCDVAVEFTNPESAVSNIITCLEAGIPLISGSTGWMDQWELVKKKCEAEKAALLYASNFSVGVNIFFEVNKQLARLMNSQEDYDISIEEVHHTQKKDAPSGTAITLAEQVLQQLARKTAWVTSPPAHKEELQITSKRIDPAPGTHIVRYDSPIDSIEISHTAHNRQGFATGAVLAAEFIQNKTGIFSMKEVLGL